jgi:hypothetical protein
MIDENGRVKAKFKIGDLVVANLLGSPCDPLLVVCVDEDIVDSEDDVFYGVLLPNGNISWLWEMELIPLEEKDE